MASSRRGSSSPRPHVPTLAAEVALRRLERLLARAEDVRIAGRKSTELENWESNIKIVLAEYYGVSSVVYQQFGRIWFNAGVFYPGQPESEHMQAFNSGVNQAKGFLESRIDDLREHTSSIAVAVAATESLPSVDAGADSRRIFVVHGHDHGALETVARFLTKLQLEPIILHEQTDEGRTIIEKFEAHASEVRCAVILLTADDIGGPKGTVPEKLMPRARQNVIFEFGYFAGSLGRTHTFALVEKDVELPSDLGGLVYISLDDNGMWRLRLVKELKAAGLEVDANHAL